MKSSAADRRIFSLIRAVPKVGNTYSIPPLLEPSAEEKSLAVSSCRFNQSFPNLNPIKQKNIELLEVYMNILVINCSPVKMAQPPRL